MAKVPKPVEGLPQRIVQGERFLLTAGDNRLHNLNEVGSRIYDLADGRRSVEEIIALIVAEYDVGEDQARRDCLDYLAELETRGLMTMEEG